MDNWLQGKYKVKRPDKYLGDVNNVRYLSSWELKFFEFCDNNPNVIKWASEEIPIHYSKPDIRTGNLVSSIYLPDIFMIYKTKDGKLKKRLVEIKPYNQTIASKSRKADKRAREQYTFIVNQCKWDAAEKWCASKGIEFKVLTEKDQFL